MIMHSKRHLLKILIGGPLALLLTTYRSANSQQQGRIDINLELSGDQPPELSPDAQFDGKVTTRQTKGLPIVTVIVGIIVISYAKELISELWDWAANGTLIIDTRNSKLNVSNIPFSTREVIVISDSGVKIFPRESTTKDVVIEAVNGTLSPGKT